MIEQSPILVTGAARSGTSIVAGIVNMCGAFGGDMSGPNRNNRRGMFENARIRNEIVKPYLQEIGVGKLGQYPLPDIGNMMIPSNWRERIEQMMVKEGYKSGNWFYKGAKMCLMWPVWDYAFPNAKWIIVRRRSADIANSCCKTGFMKAFSDPEIQKEIGVDNEYDGWIWWIRQHEERFREMLEAGLNCKVVWPERMISGDYQQMMETMEWCGLEWNSEVFNFIDSKLWKTKNRNK